MYRFLFISCFPWIYYFSLTEKTCPIYPPPTNGALACLDLSDDPACAVMCKGGFDFVSNPAWLYLCSRGQWITIPYTTGLPWPSCSGKIFINMGTTRLQNSPYLCVFKYVRVCRLQNSRFFFSKSVKKSVKRGVRVLRARSARASHAHRASLPSLALCFQPHSRPFVWLLARTWIRKNTDCFAV